MEIYDENDQPFYIYCNLGDICKIRCHQNNSCTTLNLYCYGTCLVDCKGVVSVVSGTCFDLMYGNYSQWITISPTFTPTYPTFYPTFYPTHNPARSESINCNVKNNKSAIHNLAFELSSYNSPILIGVTILCVLLVVVSKMLSIHKNYKKKNMDEAKNVRLLMKNSESKPKSKSSLHEIYLPKKIQHFSIFTFGLTVYDIFNDASTSVMLYYFVNQTNCQINKYHKYHLECIIMFVVHLSCLMLSCILNIYIIRKMFLMEFMKSGPKLGRNYDYSNSQEFRDWFKHYASRNVLFFFVCAFSAFNIELMAIFTSKTFNLNLFCAPFTFETIKFLKLQSIFAILFENIPQLTIQLIILHIGIAKNDTLSVFNTISIVWSILDILQMFIAFIIWQAVHKTHKQTIAFDDSEMDSFSSHKSNNQN